MLADLQNRLLANDDPGPRVVALHGLGGAGKTSVAVEYAHRHQAETGLAWQFPAEDPTVLTAEFSRLAAQLGARDVLDARDPVASVHAVLAAYPAPWLLVLDNAPDQVSVRRFLPPAGNGQVLITSQSPFWPPGQAMEVPVLDPPVAAGFLINRVGDPDTQAAAELAEELGRLPLALEQAAAYLQAAGGSLAEYLDWFRQRCADLLARGEPAGYGKTVATTWALAFEELEHSAPGAVGLLRLLAYCAPEPVPLPLLLKPSPGLANRLGPDVAPVLMPLLDDRLAAGDAVAALRRYSLVSMAADGLVLMHRLVQAVTVDQMEAALATQWRQAAAAVIEAAIPDNTDLPRTWPACEALLPHAQAALADATSGMGRVAAYLVESGSYSAARDLALKVVDARERALGHEHPATLAARVDLARCIGRAGDAAQARDQFAQLLPGVERAFGPEHPRTLSARAGLALWTGEAGDVAGARDLFAALLPMYEQILGREYPETLSVRRNIARYTGQAGDAAGARDQLAALLPIYEQILGREHPDCLAIRNNLAAWTGNGGDVAGARDQYAALLPIYEQILGPEHPGTLSVRHNLAYWAGEAGDVAGARDQFAALLPVYERVLGPEHPHTVIARNNLSRWAGQAGRGGSRAGQRR